MKATLKLLPLMLGIMFFFTQCEKEAVDLGSTPGSDQSIDPKSTNGCEVVQTLWAGAGQNDITKGTDVGTVTAAVNGDNLTVTYTVNEPWTLTEAHLWAGTDYSEVPRNAAPGRFPYKATLDFENGWTQNIPLADLGIDPNEDIPTIYVAAHGVVADDVYGVEGLETLLPVETVKYSIELNENTAYLNTTVSEDDFLNGVYLSYCIASGITISENTDYNANVYSSYGTIPGDLVDKPENFPYVNWIINNIAPNEDYTYGDIQRAIWELLEDNPVTLGNNGQPTTDSTEYAVPFDPNKVADIINDAMLYGENFEPSCGDYMVIILKPLPPVQPVIIWKPVPCGGTETVWAGPYSDFDYENTATFFEKSIARKWGWIFSIDCDN